MRARRLRDDRGVGTVLAVALAGVLLLVGVALAEVTGLVVEHRRAQAAADLAALAAAGGDCSAAAPVAEANGARLVACTPTGHDVVVEVSVAVDGWLGPDATLGARARAGPGVARIATRPDRR